MPQQIKRLLIAFAVFIALFLLIRVMLVPKSFGELGHFRKDAIDENTLKELRYAGKDRCIKCHDTIRMEKAEGYHAQLNCEVCHGPGLKHALYAEKFQKGTLPDSLKLLRPTTREACARCHDLNAARVKMHYDTIDMSVILMVDVKDHNVMDEDTKIKYKCIECHNPHLP